MDCDIPATHAARNTQYVYVVSGECKRISHMNEGAFNRDFWSYVNQTSQPDNRNRLPQDSQSDTSDMTPEMRNIINALRKSGRIDAEINGIPMNLYMTEVRIGDITYLLSYWERLDREPIEFEIIGFTTAIIPETGEIISDKKKFYSIEKEPHVDGKINCSREVAEKYTDDDTKERSITNEEYQIFLRKINNYLK